ncbi:nuclear transport factor 2 family protein [Achromobacter ruhlandii]|uniref:nuclear transport factor 2 family protein n=1 Tax=Achromobacter ruhlandii TaxID=72557 RepID=UPI0007BEE790|nr:nuclear transport factor 2 family protein [Achromobacter ruhlandii]
MQTRVESVIRCLNAFDVDAVLAQSTPDAVIDDVSVGDEFVGADGIRRYVEQFFVAYHTASRLLSIKRLDNRNAVVRLDFSGDFGHEIGVLQISVGADGLIESIDADLE